MPAPPRRSNASAGSALPELVDTRVAKALSHVLRQHILLAASQYEVSARDLSSTLDEDLGHVAYHVRVLRDECGGLLQETRTEKRRGAMQHFYRASTRSLMSTKALDRLDKGLGAILGGAAASDLVRDVFEAVDVGLLAAPDDLLFRTPLALDETGRRRVKEIAERAATEVEAEQVAASKRAKRRKSDGAVEAGHVFGVMSFEPAWAPLSRRERDGSG